MTFKTEIVNLVILLWSLRVELLFVATTASIIGVWIYTALRASDLMSGFELLRRQIDQGEDL